jgi:hypothetical protein
MAQLMNEQNRQDATPAESGVSTGSALSVSALGRVSQKIDPP